MPVQFRRLVARFAVAGLLLGLITVAAPEPAVAATPILDSYVSVTSVTMNSDRTVTVKLTVRREIPAQLPITLSWRYAAATRSNADYSAIRISGGPGSRTYTLKGVPAIPMVIRVCLSTAVPQNYELREYLRLVNPGFKTTYTTVTSAQAVANAVAMNVYGAVLTFAPQGRVIKFLGALAWGWTVFTDVRSSVSGASTSCPKLTAGQYMVTSTWLGIDGTYAVYNARHRVWTNKAAYDSSRAPLCDVTYVAAKYR